VHHLTPRDLCRSLANKVTSKGGNDPGVKWAEKSDHLVVAAKRVKPWSEGDDEDENNETRTTELGVRRQPARGPSREVSDLLGTAKARLHKAKGKDFSGFVAGATLSPRSPSGSFRCWLCEVSSKEPDACPPVGSERGVAV